MVLLVLGERLTASRGVFACVCDAKLPGFVPDPNSVRNNNPATNYNRSPSDAWPVLGVRGAGAYPGCSEATQRLAAALVPMCPTVG